MADKNSEGTHSPINSSGTCRALSLSASLDFCLERIGQGW